MTINPIMLDSINYLKLEHAGSVVIAGSHGGLYSASKSVSCRVRGVVLNDAGTGKNNAGIAVLDFCQPHVLPAAVVDSASARIGDVADMVRRGVISRCNAEAARLGVTARMPCTEAAACFASASPSWRPVEYVTEYRHEVTLPGRPEPVVCIDSASLIRPEDEGRIVVTGSHGGLIGGVAAKAINVAARFAAFNDAGFGMDEAGAGRLPYLDERGIAAVVVATSSAEIGNGRSTLFDGIISRANARAAENGFENGMPLAEALSRWMCG
jgi:hypothetical protein